VLSAGEHKSRLSRVTGRMTGGAALLAVRASPDLSRYTTKMTRNLPDRRLKPESEHLVAVSDDLGSVRPQFPLHRQLRSHSRMDFCCALSGSYRPIRPPSGRLLGTMHGRHG